jgi:hypothetical protein
MPEDMVGGFKYIMENIWDNKDISDLIYIMIIPYY